MSTPINFIRAATTADTTVPYAHDKELSALDAKLLPYAEALIAQWCGEIQRTGDEISMKNPLRVDANIGSFKFNAKTGAWSDFAAGGCKGYGLTSLYAAVTRKTLLDAMQALSIVAIAHTDPTKSVMGAPKRERPIVQAVDPNVVTPPPDCHPDLGFPSAEWAYADANGLVAFYVYRFESDGKKETRPVSYSPEKNAWVWQYPSTPFPPYHLPQLLKRPEATVVITEGEKAADAAARQFPSAVVITSACGSDQAPKTDWSPLKGRKIIIAPDKDAPGRKYALAVTAAALAQGASSVGVLDVWTLADWNAGDDLADHEVAEEFLDTAIDAATLFSQPELEPHLAKAAAQLSNGDFDRIKPALARQLGVGIRTLDALVKDARIKDKEDAAPETTPEMFPDDALEPWTEPVDGDKLFAEIVGLVTRYVVLTASQATAVAIWILFSYGYEVMRICPKLLINSPSKRCGKSTLMEVIMALVRRALPAANITPAAIFRAIESWKPTLLIDEADTFLNRGGNEELTGILNSGHTRAFAYVVRTVEIEGKHVPAKFSTFAPQVIAMIKTPTDTLIDRSIVVTLARKMPGQNVDALTIDAAEQFKDTRRRVMRWMDDNLANVKFDLGDIPLIGNDRARQNWAVLAAFTKMLGPQAHHALLNAAAELADTSGIEENVETDLLADIRETLVGHKDTFIASRVLTKKLEGMPESRWSEINHGKPITGHQLATRLKPFSVMPGKHRDGTATVRGYSITKLQAVFDRYLPLPSGGAE